MTSPALLTAATPKFTRPYISDSFNRADSSSSAGSTDAYLGGATSAWTASGSTFGISSNRLYAAVGSGEGQLAVSAGATEVEVIATIVTRPSGASKSCGLMARRADANNFYLAQVSNAGQLGFYKRVAGTYTGLAGSLTKTVSAGQELMLRCEGSHISVWVDGVLFYYVVDTSLSAGQGVGVREDGDTAWRIDNFRAQPITPWATFARSAAGVVLRGASGTWEDVDVANPDVKWDAALNCYVMMYSGFDGTNWATGLAYSTDLRTWTKEPTNPILTISGSETYIAGNSGWAKLGSTYFQYYQAIVGGVTEIYAASASALTGPWTKLGKVIAVGGTDTEFTADPMARLMDDGVTIELLYTSSGARLIRRATSTDGTTFGSKTTLFTASSVPSGGFAASQGGEPFLLRDGSAMHVFFDGAVTTDYRSIHEGRSTDGGTTWSFRPYRLPKGATGSFDDVQVFDCSALLVGSTLYLFYAGARNPGGGHGMGADIGLAIIPWGGASY